MLELKNASAAVNGEALTSPPKPGPAKKWTDSHQQMLYVFFSLYNKSDQHRKLLATTPDKEFIKEILRAAQMKFGDRAIGETTIAGHLEQLAAYLNQAEARPPDR